MRYGIRTEQVIIDGEVYKLSPLKGKFYADFMSLATKLDGKEGSALTGEDYELITEMLTASLMESDKEANKEEVKVFASQNLVSFFEPLVKVNSPKQ